MNHSGKRLERHRLRAVAIAVAALALAGCGDSAKKEAPSQIAAKVNGEELSIHQINQLLQRQQNLKPEQADGAGRQVLERLIDQEIAVQKAQDLKLDRQPKVMQSIEAAKREIVARAYVERLGEAAQRPSADEITKYYADSPALFSQRRIYSLHEIAVEARPEQMDDLRSRVKAAKSLGELVEQLKTADYRFNTNSAVRAAEQLPLTMLPEFAKMKDGQAVMLPSASGAQIVFLANSRSQPIDATRAAPIIEQFLLTDRRRTMVESDIKALRAAAKIEYVGKYAASAPAAASAAAAQVEVPTAAAAAAVPTAAPAPATAPRAAAASAAGMDAATISKGMGFK